MASSAPAAPAADAVACADSAVVLAVSNCPPVYRSVSELRSHFGMHGGRFIPETLLSAHEELEAVYVKATADPAFRAEVRASLFFSAPRAAARCRRFHTPAFRSRALSQFELLGRDFIGRDTPLYFASRLTAAAGGAQIWLKREELAHTGACAV